MDDAVERAVTVVERIEECAEGGRIGDVDGGGIDLRSGFGDGREGGAHFAIAQGAAEFAFNGGGRRRLAVVAQHGDHGGLELALVANGGEFGGLGFGRQRRFARQHEATAESPREFGGHLRGDAARAASDEDHRFRGEIDAGFMRAQRRGGGGEGDAPAVAVTDFEFPVARAQFVDKGFDDVFGGSGGCEIDGFAGHFGPLASNGLHQADRSAAAGPEFDGCVRHAGEHAAHARGGEEAS